MRLRLPVRDSRAVPLEAIAHAAPAEPRLWDYGELLKNLVTKDLKLKYRGSVIGFLWSLLTPLAMIVAYSIAFRYILRVGLENFTLFLITGLLPWNFFSGAAMGSLGAVSLNANLVKKIYFPRELLPLATVLFNLVQFLLALLVFFPALLVLGARFTPALAAYPVVLALHLAFTLGVGFFLSAVSVFFQDARHMTEVGLMVLFWLTPIVYHVSMVPQGLQRFFLYSPLAAFTTAYQDIVYWGRWPSASSWASGGLWAAGALAFGWIVFNRYKRSFAEEL